MSCYFGGAKKALERRSIVKTNNRKMASGHGVYDGRRPLCHNIIRL
uniref:Uncharacterized protein n=1 Tax=Anguilla anguilla TaxID=7936 RepID=A0A0E9T7L4_ANGAN